MNSIRPIGRAQRAALVQIVASIASARGEHQAAVMLLTTDPDDDIFNNYLGPVIDELIDDYAGLGAEAD